MKRKVPFDAIEANQIVILLVLLFIGAMVLVADIASGQTLDTSGWQTAENQLAQCGPGMDCLTGNCPLPPLRRPPNLIQRPQTQQPSRQPSAPVAQPGTRLEYQTINPGLPQWNADFPALCWVQKQLNGKPGPWQPRGDGTWIREEAKLNAGMGVLFLKDRDRDLAYVLTAYHLLRESGTTITCHFASGPKLARVVKLWQDWDLALLAICKPPEPAMELANYKPPVGTAVSTGGYGGGNWHWVPCRVQGYGYVGRPDQSDWMQVAGSQNVSGDSGTAVLDQEGRIAGIAWGIGNGVTSATVCTRIWQLISGEISIVPSSPSAPADGSAPYPQGTPAAGVASTDAAGANAEQWAAKLADSIDALRAEMASIKAGASVNVDQAVSQAVNVQMEGIGQQLIDKELVPLKARIDKLESDYATGSRMTANESRINEHAGALANHEDSIAKLTLQQQAFQLALASIPPGQKGEKGDKGEPGAPGKDAVVDYDAIVGLVLDRLPKQPQAADGLYADLVYDSDGDYWAWMQPEAEQAKTQFSLRLVEAPDGHDFGTLPQLVFYRSGTPIKRVAGSSDVWQMLSMIRGGKDLVLKE